MSITGPDFLALQVRDVARAAEFYETRLGLRRLPASPPGAVVFATSPIPFAVREPLPGVDVAQISPRPGEGVALWMQGDHVEALHASLVASGVEILRAPEPGPFGVAFTFADPGFIGQKVWMGS